jgi:RNA polymerase sigma factor (sigma-70 family)
MDNAVDVQAGEPGDAQDIAASIADPERFAPIFERHFDAVHRYLVRRLGVTLADDLAAQVFTIAFERRRSFDPNSANARPWLYGIASNLIRSNRRAERRLLAALARVHSQSADRGGSDAPTPLDPAEHARLAAALGRLKPEQRDVLLLHCWAELSHAEIAVVLGIPPGTVASRLARARRRVRAAMGGRDQPQSEPTMTSQEDR